jgi:hypothetical protein
VPILRGDAFVQFFRRFVWLITWIDAHRSHQVSGAKSEKCSRTLREAHLDESWWQAGCSRFRHLNL